MPKGGWYFGAIIRQEPMVENSLDPRDNVEECGPISEAELEHYRREAERLFTETDKAIFASFGGTSFGDVAGVRGGEGGMAPGLLTLSQ